MSQKFNFIGKSSKIRKRKMLTFTKTLKTLNMLKINILNVNILRFLYRNFNE